MILDEIFMISYILEDCLKHDSYHAVLILMSTLFISIYILQENKQKQVWFEKKQKEKPRKLNELSGAQYLRTENLKAEKS